MQKIKAFSHNSLLVAGERIAFLLVILVFSAVFFLESADPAFSEEDIEYSGFSKNGLTYDFYLNTSHTESSFENIEEIPNVFREESTMEHIVIAKAQDVTGDIWDKLAACESRGNWGINTGNGYFGGLQFSQGAWSSVGGAGLPHEHSREEQIERAKLLQAKRGWGVWGMCAKKLGL